MPLEFGEFVFEDGVGLRARGQAVHLPPKALALLRTLLQARGRLVSRDALARTAWPGQDVSDQSIDRAISRLRAAMRRATGEDVVATSYGNGFRIRAEVREHGVPAARTARSIADSASAEAIEALLSARELLGRRSPQDLVCALDATGRAIELDPRFVPAWCARAELHALQIGRGLIAPACGGRLVIEAAQAALALQPACGPALALRGWVRATIENDVGAGLEDCRQALQVDDHYWGSHVLQAWVLAAAGRADEAAEAAQRARALNPEGLAVNALPALYLLFAGRHDEAHALARTLARRFPTLDNAQAIASTVAAVQGEHDEAVHFGEQAARLAPDTPLLHLPLAYAQARAGRLDAARQTLASVLAATTVPLNASVAPVALALGEADRARALLAAGRALGEPQAAWSALDPRLR